MIIPEEEIYKAITYWLAECDNEPEVLAHIAGAMFGGKVTPLPEQEGKERLFDFKPNEFYFNETFTAFETEEEYKARIKLELNSELTSKSS